MTYDALIIGGGLAGCSAAIQLAQQGFSTLLLEKQTYPAHKLCGEFLSTEVIAAFERLGVMPAVRAAGAHSIRHSRVTAPGGSLFEAPLPGTALGLSRYALDRLLFEHAAATGADVQDGTPVQAVEGNLAEGFSVRTSAETFSARVVLGAYGKRGVLDRKLERPFFEKQTPFVAFKAHYEGLALPSTIELHAFPGGYCGLSHIEGEQVNACWITHEDALKASGGRPEGMIEGAMAENAVLAARFRAMRRVSPSFLAISQISFAPKEPFDGDVCMVGDTAGLITPLCGDGMAMALYAAELAAPLTARYLRRNLTADAFRQHYARLWKQTFRPRLCLGRVLHHAYIRPPVANLAVQACRTAPGLGRWVIRKTRG